MFGGVMSVCQGNPAIFIANSCILHCMQVLAIVALIAIAFGIVKMCFNDGKDCGNCCGECYCEVCGPPLFVVGVVLFWDGLIALVIFLIVAATGGFN